MITRSCVWFTFKDGHRIEIPCHRHSDAYYIIAQLVDRDKIDKPLTEEGFWDENARFLDRHQAYHEALRCNQIKSDNDHAVSELLYSEDLW